MQTEEQKRKKRKKVLKIVGAVVALLLLVGCCGIGGLMFLGSEPTPTSEPTLEVIVASPLPTLAPTEAPTATSTPRPTWTPHPTYTPQPTETPTSERTEAQVIEVVDGDTIKVEIEGTIYTVRYIGIDTPETVHPSKPVEWMGPEATEANRQLVGNQIVYLEKDVSETDRYGRLLLYVFLADGTFVNAELVRLGYAQVSTYPPDVLYQDLFLEMQQEARVAKRGLWVMPIPPTTAPAEPTAAPTAPPTKPPAAATSQPALSPAWWMCPDSTEGAAYVGSARSDKYHRLSCRWASEISAANRICFANRQAALDKGYQACKVCKP